MPSVYIEGKEIQRVHTLKHLGVSFDRSLCGKEHISEITIKARKGLVALKTMAYARMSQKKTGNPISGSDTAISIVWIRTTDTICNAAEKARNHTK